MQRKTLKKLSSLLACGSIFALSNQAKAIEGNGLPIYLNGLESYMGGALPGPGNYLLMYGGSMQFDSVRDRHGERIDIPGFKVNSSFIAPRFIWVSEQKFLGGQFALHTIVPLVTLKEQAMGLSKRRSGVGDIVFGPALGYHFNEKSHALVAVDFVAPTGSYRKGEMANIGSNHWAIQPLAAWTYTQPKGINMDVKVTYDFNMKNKDTDTRSGQAIHMDYAVGYALGNNWSVGVGGYAYQQLREDKGPNSGDGKARALGAGPNIRYMNDKGWLFTAKWQHDFNVRSRPKGNQLYLKAAIPF